MLIALDLETTGLDPERCSLLAVGLSGPSEAVQAALRAAGVECGGWVISGEIGGLRPSQTLSAAICSPRDLVVVRALLQIPDYEVLL